MAEHKRRARWRLLGALILVGAVAAVAPILLEDQARPLSQDLLVQMPTRPVAPPAERAAQPAAAASITTPEKPAVESEPPKAEPTKAEPSKAEPAKPEPSKTVMTKGFMVQVGAYASKEAATRVKTRLEASGHRVTIQAIKTADGAERHRVRIGPFETRDQAIEIRDRAKSQGYDAAVVAAS